eukprot:COSAG04_NODE_9202_length_887_cov_2.116751_1_plen_117_part_01
MVECEFLPLPLLIAGAGCGSFRSPELTGGLPRGSDVDYAEFEANRMTAEDRAFFDENGYVRPPLPAPPLRFGARPVESAFVNRTSGSPDGARLQVIIHDALPQQDHVELLDALHRLR